MQYKKLMLFFFVTLPFATLLRFFELEFIIDPKNGFFTTDNQVFGLVATIILFAIAMLICIFAFTTHRSPEHPPKHNYFLSATSFCLSALVFYDTFFVKTISESSSIFNILKLIFAICTIIFLLFFAAKSIFAIKIPDFCYLFPCFFIIVKTITEFTRIASIAIITDNLFLISAFCSVMVFFLQFAKLYNNLDTEKNFRKILASGLVSVFLCTVQSVAYFCFGFLNNFENVHTTVSTNILLLGFALFIVAFTLSHFSKKNSCEN